MLSHIRRYLIAGLLVWVPILITILILKFIIGILDQFITILPVSWQPNHVLGWNAPGFGLLISILVILLTGMVASNFLGSQVVEIWDRFVNRIPVVRSIYSGVKQIMETLFTPGGNAFRKVLLIEYPRKGMWSIAFQTGDTAPVISQETGQEMVTIFIPTTPNPTSGFLMMVPKNEAIVLDIPIDQALKFVISLGVVTPVKRLDS